MKKRKCVKCGSKEHKGGWIGVNVYDPVVGRDMGVECGRRECKVEKGTPAYHKLHWYRHFLLVALQPDWFVDYAYDEFWKEFQVFIKEPKVSKRIPELRQMIEKRWGKQQKKWWQFWK